MPKCCLIPRDSVTHSSPRAGGQYNLDCTALHLVIFVVLLFQSFNMNPYTGFTGKGTVMTCICSAQGVALLEGVALME